ncbi:MAG: hypothetical protein ABIP55_00245 [Tepidisphaeraceae bacterium]
MRARRSLECGWKRALERAIDVIGARRARKRASAKRQKIFVRKRKIVDEKISGVYSLSQKGGTKRHGS